MIGYGIVFAFPSWRDEGRKQNGFPVCNSERKAKFSSNPTRQLSLRTPRELHNSAWWVLQIRYRFIIFSLVVKGVVISAEPTQYNNDLVTIAKVRKIYFFQRATLWQCQQGNYSIKYLTDSFQIQEEFTTPFEQMLAEQLNKCLQTVLHATVRTRKRDGSFYNKKF